jgi:hypothetical protein
VIGATLARVASRLLRHETFESIASPAIADLQFESRDAGLGRLILGYAAAGAACVRALLHDLCLDVGVAFGRSTSTIWARGAFGYAVLVLLLTIVTMVTGDERHMRFDGQMVSLAFHFTSAVFGTLFLAMFGITFALGRARPAERRAIVLAALIIASSASLANLAARPARVELRAQRDAAVWQMWGGPVYQDLSLGEIARRLADPVARQADSRLRPIVPPARSDGPPELFLGAVMLSCSLIGLALSRAYGWRLLRRILAMMLAWRILTTFSALAIMLLDVPIGRMPGLLPAALMMLAFGAIFVAIPPTKGQKQRAA